MSYLWLIKFCTSHELLKTLANVCKDLLASHTFNIYFIKCDQYLILIEKQYFLVFGLEKKNVHFGDKYTLYSLFLYGSLSFGQEKQLPRISLQFSCQNYKFSVHLFFLICWSVRKSITLETFNKKNYLPCTFTVRKDTSTWRNS